jgi:phage recombination protein Bet
VLLFTKNIFIMQIQSIAGITPAQIETLAQAGVIPSGTPAAQVEVFAEACRQHGLSPFRKEIYLVKYGSTFHTIVGIDGLQQKAARTGRLAGVDAEQYDLKSDGTYLTAAEVKAQGRRPVSCTVTIYAIIGGIRCPFTATALFDEFYPNPTNKAASMPFNMISKCARAKALKMAFSDELSGLHIEEEAAAFEDKTIAAVQVNPAKGVDVEQLQQDIDMCGNKNSLLLLYKSNPEYRHHAALFTARREEIEALEAEEMKMPDAKEIKRMVDVIENVLDTDLVGEKEGEDE